MSWVTALVVVGALVLGGAVAWSRGALNPLICGGSCGPENVVPPDALVASGRAGDSAVRTEPTGTLDAAALSKAVAGPLRDADLGDRVGLAASVVGGPVTTVGTDAAFTPASTAKVLTSFTALTQLDPERRFTTRTVLDGDRIVLVGGGDPYLVVDRSKGDPAVERAELTRLARDTARAATARKVGTVRLGYDTSLFSGPAASPDWEPSYVSGRIVSPVSALWVGRGTSGGVRVPDPAASAASTFAGLLRDRGLSVEGDPSRVEAPEGARTLAAVRSATVAQISEHLISTSDNEAAEVMLRQAALAAGRPGSFTGGAKTVRATLRAAGVPVDGLRLSDGSGLSRKDRVEPRTLVGTLSAAANRSRTSSLLADLPVGAFNGTLRNRFAKPTDVRGAVRAKTGTLTGIHSLAGVVTDREGTPIVLTVMTDRTAAINPFATQAALDDVASAVAACRCSG
ncbi:MAG: D-alanyl-D-alanine carboxypeptidase/D-alanyl-D-alanine-endopeptidase [Aeromicrobium erythreum]